MTDREKKQRDILRNLANELDQLFRQRHTKKDEDYAINQALAELDAIPISKEVEEADIEELAEQLHKWYLRAIAWVKKFKDGEPFSHNPDAQKEYKDLSEEQKYIDRYIAKQIIQAVKPKEEVGVEEIEKIIDEHEDWLWTETNEKRVDITEHNKILAQKIFALLKRVKK